MTHSCIWEADSSSKSGSARENLVHEAEAQAVAGKGSRRWSCSSTCSLRLVSSRSPSSFSVAVASWRPPSALSLEVLVKDYYYSTITTATLASGKEHSVKEQLPREQKLYWFLITAVVRLLITTLDNVCRIMLLIMICGIISSYFN